MQVKETSSEGLRREFKIVVPKDDIEGRLVARLNEVGQTVNVPGFRPGKVPVAVLRKRYGEAVRGEILERMIQDSVQKTIEDHDLRPAAEPKIDLVTFEEGADLEYTLTLDVLPEIEQPDIASIELERLVVEVPDADVDAAVGRIAEQNKAFSAAEGRAAESGDQVLFNFIGRIGGEAFEGGSAEGFELELGSGRFIPGFEDQMIGMKPGEKRDVKVTFPEDYGAENLKGKEAVFEVDVTEVRTAAAVEVSDEFAKSIGAEDLAALKSMIREQIGSEYQQVTRGRLKRDLLDALADMVDFEVPPGLLEHEFNDIWRQIEDAKSRDALDEEDKGKSEDELKEHYRGVAQRRIRLGLLLAEVGRANNLTVTQDDLNRAIAEQARRFPGQEAQVMQFYQQNHQAMHELQAPIFEEKVVDYMLELAQVTERTVTAEELLSEEDSDGDGAEGKAKGKGKAKAKKKKSAKGKAK
jgi:trigger factor